MPVATKGRQVGQPAMGREADEEAHGEGSQDVHGEDTERKGGMPEEPDKADPGEIAQNGADGATCGDMEDGSDHGGVMVWAPFEVNGDHRHAGAENAPSPRPALLPQPLEPVQPFLQVAFEAAFHRL
jgi:hypothetical protein